VELTQALAKEQAARQAEVDEWEAGMAELNKQLRDAIRANANKVCWLSLLSD
jgi:hypothetical protein